MSANDRPRSVLDDLGEEITGIMAPVSICMALVVVLVKVLNPDGQADTSTVAIATIAYHEKARPTMHADLAMRTRVPGSVATNSQKSCSKQVLL